MLLEFFLHFSSFFFFFFVNSEFRIFLKGIFGPRNFLDGNFGSKNIFRGNFCSRNFFSLTSKIFCFQEFFFLKIFATGIFSSLQNFFTVEFFSPRIFPLKILAAELISVHFRLQKFFARLPGFFICRTFGSWILFVKFFSPKYFSWDFGSRNFLCEFLVRFGANFLPLEFFYTFRFFFLCVNSEFKIFCGEFAAPEFFRRNFQLQEFFLSFKDFLPVVFSTPGIFLLKIFATGIFF